jgi:hypothetical protein
MVRDDARRSELSDFSSSGECWLEERAPADVTLLPRQHEHRSPHDAGLPSDIETEAHGAHTRMAGRRFEGSSNSHVRSRATLRLYSWKAKMLRLPEGLLILVRVIKD